MIQNANGCRLFETRDLHLINSAILFTVSRYGVLYDVLYSYYLQRHLHSLLIRTMEFSDSRALKWRFYLDSRKEEAS